MIEANKSSQYKYEEKCQVRLQDGTKQFAIHGLFMYDSFFNPI
jgi:hypothetical protein